MRPAAPPAPGDRSRSRRIAFFETHYTLVADRLQDDRGAPPTLRVSELIRRYAARWPNAPAPPSGAWCSFRELPGAGPLAVNFAANTHKTLTMTFKDDLSCLDRSTACMAGRLEPRPGFDRRYCFYALPEVPLVLTYNAGDDLFPAQAHLLFRRSCQEVLEVRDLFALGTYLTGRLVAPNTSPAASWPQEAV